MQTFSSATRRPRLQRGKAEDAKLIEVLAKKKFERSSGRDSRGRVYTASNSIFNIEKMRSHHTTLYYTRVNNPFSLLIPKQEHPPQSCRGRGACEAAGHLSAVLSLAGSVWRVTGGLFSRVATFGQRAKFSFRSVKPLYNFLLLIRQ